MYILVIWVKINKIINFEYNFLLAVVESEEILTELGYNIKADMPPEVHKYFDEVATNEVGQCCPFLFQSNFKLFSQTYVQHKQYSHIIYIFSLAKPKQTISFYLHYLSKKYKVRRRTSYISKYIYFTFQ